jgi:hypothetical protein
VILFSDLAKNQLTGEIPRLIYWNEVLQYLWVFQFLAQLSTCKIIYSFDLLIEPL